ncbi:MAG: alpha/beta hydrolase [Pseudomonadota bacterium]
MSQAQLEKLVGLLRERQADRPEPLTPGPMRANMELLGTRFAPPEDAVVQRVFVAGCTAEWVSAPNAIPDNVVLYLHGGGYVQGSPNTHRNLAYHLARSAAAKVLVLDYRLAPEHPFPAPVHDAVAAWRWLLEQGYSAEHMAVAGDSAGGGLCIAAQVQMRNEGLPPPVACVAISPWTDLEGIGESMTSKAEVDPMVGKEMLSWFAAQYLQGAPPQAPLASPIYADLRGLAPMLIQVGTAETLLDDANRLAAAARVYDVEVELRHWQDMVHVWHLFQPMLDEAGEALVEAGEWLKARL